MLYRIFNFFLHHIIFTSTLVFLCGGFFRFFFFSQQVHVNLVNLFFFLVFFYLYAVGSYHDHIIGSWRRYLVLQWRV